MNDHTDDIDRIPPAPEDMQDSVLDLQEQTTDDDVQAHVMVLSSVSYVQGQPTVC
jgi:hypothetical protein